MWTAEQEHLLEKMGGGAATEALSKLCSALARQTTVDRMQTRSPFLSSAITAKVVEPAEY